MHLTQLITARQRSCQQVMFSLVCVRLFTEEKSSHVTIILDALDLSIEVLLPPSPSSPRHVQTCLTLTTLYRGSSFHPQPHSLLEYFLVIRNDLKFGWPIICTGNSLSTHENYNIVWDNRTYSSVAKARFFDNSCNDRPLLPLRLKQL